VKGLTKISKIFAFSSPFGKFSSILHRAPNSAQGGPRKILRTQNPNIPSKNSELVVHYDQSKTVKVMKLVPVDSPYVISFSLK